MFGGLFGVCVSDEYVKERKLLVDGVLFVIFGLGCSFATTYILSAAGFLL